MLLFAGMMLAFVINGLGNLMALIQIYIFPLDEPKLSFCEKAAFMELFGLILYSIYQVLIDLCFYLNIYHWDSYEKFLNMFMMKV